MNEIRRGLSESNKEDRKKEKADSEKELKKRIKELEEKIKEKDETLKKITKSIPEIRFWKLFNPKKFEKALQNSYEMLQIVMDNIPENIFWKDINLVYLGCNKNYANLIGVKTPQNIIGKTDSELLKENYKAAYLKECEIAVINSDKPEYNIVEKWIFNNGNEIWLEINRIPLHDSSGKSAGILITYDDITKKIISERKLVESEKKFRTITEQSLMGIAILQNGFSKYINKTASEIIGYPIEALLNQSLENLDRIVHPDDLASVIEFTRMIHTRDGIDPASFRLINKLGKEKWVEIHSDTILYKGKSAKLIFLYDITEKREAERLIIEENLKLLKLDEMRKDLITRVSHELKTPLISVFSGSELLLELCSTKVDNETLEIIKLINKGGKRLKNLIDNLLDISIIESGEFDLNKKTENLPEIIKESVLDVEFHANKREICIEVNLPDELYLEIDKIRIIQVLTNILSNAVKNTPSMGRVFIDLKENDEYIDIVIKDTGVGLTKEEIDKIFKKFGKIERYGKLMDVEIGGTGLGLYLSKELVEMHEGEILVDSEGRNKGATFTIRFFKNLEEE